MHVDALSVGTVYSDFTNGTSTQVLIDRNLGTTYNTTDVAASGAASGSYSVYNLVGNNVELTLPSSAGTAIGRYIYVTAAGTGCKILPGVTGDLLNGGTVVGPSGMSVAQGASEVLCVSNSTPGWVVISKYIPS